MFPSQTWRLYILFCLFSLCCPSGLYSWSWICFHCNSSLRDWFLKRHEISYHIYANDTQIYLSLKRNYGSSIKPLMNCLKDIKAWMALSLFNFNESQTEIIVFGPSGVCDAPLMDLDPLLPYFKPTVQNLGVKIDSDFKLDQQIYLVLSFKLFRLLFQHAWTTVMHFTLDLTRPPSHVYS